MSSPAKSEVATVTSKPPPDHKDNEKDVWSSENVVQAQSEDPDIGRVVDQLLREWKKPTDGELRPLSRATREICSRWELLELRGVLFLRSPEGTPSAKSRMVLPQKRVKESLVEVHNGLTGAHLGRIKTLKKMKTRFWRPGLTKEVHWYCSSCLICAKCKSRPKPKAPLHPIPSGNPMQRLHIDIVGPLPRSRMGNRYILTVQCSFTKWAEAYAIPNQRATNVINVTRTGKYRQFLSSLNYFNRVAESHPRKHTPKSKHTCFSSEAYTMYHAQSAPLQCNYSFQPLCMPLNTTQLGQKSQTAIFRLIH